MDERHCEEGVLILSNGRDAHGVRVVSHTHNKMFFHNDTATDLVSIGYGLLYSPLTFSSLQPVVFSTVALHEGF